MDSEKCQSFQSKTSWIPLAHFPEPSVQDDKSQGRRNVQILHELFRINNIKDSIGVQFLNLRSRMTRPEGEETYGFFTNCSESKCTKAVFLLVAKIPLLLFS
ncbi:MULTISPECIES: hypothetical protein [unclassified Sphingobacterium]|uniref:hypothetical protein n=1 Tax=unclassified Sphingobacterium TaxID=2609468 RepID=UPI0020C55BFA|nr:MULTISPECIES: hypothetical protein [unclassified Sphingobacterium]